MVVFFLDFFFLFLKSWRKKRKKKTDQEKNSNTFTQQLTNQGRVLFSCFFFLDLAKNILCMLTNSFQNVFLKKRRKNKNQNNSERKKNCTQHVNYCTRERLQVLRQCKSIAPIQIMHSMGDGGGGGVGGVCWCRAHGLKLPTGES